MLFIKLEILQYNTDVLLLRQWFRNIDYIKLFIMIIISVRISQKVHNFNKKSITLQTK